MALATLQSTVRCLTFLKCKNLPARIVVFPAPPLQRAERCTFNPEHSIQRHASWKTARLRSRRGFSVRSLQEAPNRSTGADRTDDALFFSEAGLERAAVRRQDPAWLEKQLQDSATQIVPVWRGRSLVRGRRGVLLSAAECDVWQLSPGAKAGPGPIFLGLVNQPGDEVAVFALDCSHQERSDTGVDLARELAGDGAEFVDLRKRGPELPPGDAGLLALARGLCEWHSRNRFCARCGSSTYVTDGGHSVKCSKTTCATSAYPRLDPAVIMLVACGDYVLLGRQKRWVPGRYSLLAGFVETGETMEMAVQREVLEESGVIVHPGSIQYIASQPWPFPCSLMIGFSAEAPEIAASTAGSPPADELEPGAGSSQPPALLEDEREALAYSRLPYPQVDEKELEDVRWFHRDWLRSVLFPDIPSPPMHGCAFSVPGHYAIARRLIQRWLSQPSLPDIGPWPGDRVWPVEIDVGVFKYVLLRVRDANYFSRTKLVVRGDRDAENHMDIYNHFAADVKPLGLQVEVLGGGRIEHYPEQKVISVYGYSFAFGRANHRITAALLHRWFPLYDAISTSDEGY